MIDNDDNNEKPLLDLRIQRPTTFIRTNWIRNSSIKVILGIILLFCTLHVYRPSIHDKQQQQQQHEHYSYNDRVGRRQKRVGIATGRKSKKKVIISPFHHHFMRLWKFPFGTFNIHPEKTTTKMTTTTTNPESSSLSPTMTTTSSSETTKIQNIINVDTEQDTSSMPQSPEWDESMKLQYQQSLIVKEEQSYNLPPENLQWCSPPTLPPLNYSNCNSKDNYVSGIPLYGGLTNGLKFILLGAIASMERKECFFIDETYSIFPKDKGRFLEQYFEPIGIAPHSPEVLRAHSEQRIAWKFWPNLWTSPQGRRIRDSQTNLTALDNLYINVNGHDLKRHMLQRLWRPLPHVRKATCMTLERLLGGQTNPYIAFSIPPPPALKDNTTTEKTDVISTTTLQQYIRKAEQQVFPQHFSHDGTKIVFVATPDCTTVQMLQQLRPHWTIVSAACDDDDSMTISTADNHNNIIPTTSTKAFWGEYMTPELDRHFYKLFVELFALAQARACIGVWYSNVSWWVYFMRKKTAKQSFYLLDTPESRNVDGTRIMDDTSTDFW